MQICKFIYLMFAQLLPHGVRWRLGIDALLLLCSLCPTFASVAVFINNARWDGVPFLLKAGKALASRRAEIRVQFHTVPGCLYQDKMGHDPDRSTNELVRVDIANFELLPMARRIML